MEINGKGIVQIYFAREINKRQNEKMETTKESEKFLVELEEENRS